jgi:hypothetical protein
MSRHFYYSRARASAAEWRALEIAIIDILRRRGCRFDYRDGVTYLIAEFFDDDTGELLHRQRIICLEQLARDLAETLR